MLLYAREIDESEIAEDAWEVFARLIIRIRDGCEMTLKGIYSHDHYMYAIGGMDFLEVFRFEEDHFMLLLEVLEIPEVVTIHRCDGCIWL